MNKNGAKNLRSSVGNIAYKIAATASEDDALIVDIRDEEDFKKNHIPDSINIMAVSDTSKFETWLGSIVQPDEKFHLIVDAIENAEKILHRTAKIGYEINVKSIFTMGEKELEESADLNLEDFKKNETNYTIVDIRNDSEVAEGKIFESAIAIPLHQLREKAGEIPTDKPIVVHCAGGYRSAAGSSILEKELQTKNVFDLSDDIEKFKKS